MCGLTGFIDPRGRLADPQHHLARMTATLSHRGPDDQGLWFEPADGVGLGHRRLSIIDLSPEGHQPMVSSSGRFVIAYNGEVYNFRELRAELEQQGCGFRGHSDTEVLLNAIEHRGLERAVSLCVGMFAFALWDRKIQTLFLVRDRLGIKPLYYGVLNDALVFGSELKALRAFPGFRQEINRDALALFLRHNYIPTPYSIYRDVHKLPPGSILAYSPRAAASQRLRIDAYWCAKTLAERGQETAFPGSAQDAVEELDTLLNEAVRARMIADVPLGAFLSGGIDSSTVAGLMQANANRPIKTFAIGFHQQGFDEAAHAKAVARHLGAEHTELYVEPADALAVIPRLPALYDEPFSDSSQIPTFLVSELARRHVTVSLSGDGGDELFCGYNRYTWGRRIWRSLGWTPVGLRSALGRALITVSPTTWDKLISPVRALLPPRLRPQQFGDNLHKLAQVLSIDDPDVLYQRLVSHWKEPSTVVCGGTEPPSVLTDRRRQARLPDFTQRMMFLDLISYLPDDILTKVDRASMGVGLEARVPLLDHRVVEFALRLPLWLKLHHGQGKWPLRQVLYRYVPQTLVERPKMGFGVPIGAWLRGPLRDWAAAYLDEQRLRREGYFHPEPLLAAWHEHLAGQRDWSYYLWDILMFQAWLESQETQ